MDEENVNAALTNGGLFGKLTYFDSGDQPLAVRK
jgi:hypothetical protein